MDSGAERAAGAESDTDTADGAAPPLDENIDRSSGVHMVSRGRERVVESSSGHTLAVRRCAEWQ